MNKKGGVGIAAPQVGVPKRLFLVEVGDFFEVFINPKIVQKSKETVTVREGCLSFPGMFVDKTRHVSVTVEYQNQHGNLIHFIVHPQIPESLLISQCIQHEIEHLDGILLIDSDQK